MTASDTRGSFADWKTGEFTDALADRVSVPGGGAAAGAALAQAAALGGMVVAFTRGKTRYASHETLLEAAEGSLAAIRTGAWRLADRDAEGFEALSSLWPLAEDDPVRRERWPAAVRAAIAAPEEIIRSAADTVAVLAGLVGRTTPQLRSDLAIAARFAALAAEAAAWNVEMNLDALSALPDGESEAADLRAAMPTLLADIGRTAELIDDACRAGGRQTIA